jgi:hypothetical protein
VTEVAQTEMLKKFDETQDNINMTAVLGSRNTVCLRLFSAPPNRLLLLPVFAPNTDISLLVVAVHYTPSLPHNPSLPSANRSPSLFTRPHSTPLPANPPSCPSPPVANCAQRPQTSPSSCAAHLAMPPPSTTCRSWLRVCSCPHLLRGQSPYARPRASAAESRSLGGAGKNPTAPQRGLGPPCPRLKLRPRRTSLPSLTPRENHLEVGESAFGFSSTEVFSSLHFLLLFGEAVARAEKRKAGMLAENRSQAMYCTVVCLCSPPAFLLFYVISQFHFRSQPSNFLTPSSSHVVLMISPTSETSDQPLPKLPPVNVSPPSLASKFAAHFTSSKSKYSSTQGEPSPNLANNRLTLTPPLPGPCRSNSLDSARSSGSGARSATPRPKRPTITVSLSPPHDPMESQRYSPSFSPSSGTALSSPASGESYMSSPTSPNSDSEASHRNGLDMAWATNLTPPASPGTNSPNAPDAAAPSESYASSDYGQAYSSSGPHGVEHPRDGPDPQRDMPTSVPRRDVSDGSVRAHRRAQHSVSVVKVLENVLGTPVDLDSGEDSDEEDNPKRRTMASFSSEMNAAIETATIPDQQPKSEPSSRRSSKVPATQGVTLPGPPSIPLPRTPDLSTRASMASMSSIPTIPSLPSVSTRKSSLSIRAKEAQARPRAHTMSSVPPVVFSRTTTPTSSRPSSSQGAMIRIRPSKGQGHGAVADAGTDSSGGSGEGREMAASSSDGASPASSSSAETQQLRLALAAQGARFEELAAYLVSVTQKHTEEKAILERKIITLEAEAEKREKELQGLRWLVMHGTGASGAAAAAVISGGINGVSSSRPPSRPSSRSGEDGRSSRRSSRKQDAPLLLTSKGGDMTPPRPSPNKYSHDLSDEARSTTKVNGGSASDAVKLARHMSSSATLPVPVEHYKANGWTETAGVSDSSVLNTLSVGGDKRSSVSSFSSAGSSTTGSSLSSPPSMSNLTAIPESRPPSASSSSQSLSSNNNKTITMATLMKLSRMDPAVVAVIQDAEKQQHQHQQQQQQQQKDKDESRRSSRASKRVSGPSNGSVTPAPATSLSSNAALAYANNLKKSRPPSFAQVMDSPGMSGVLEKLRSFGGSDGPPPVTSS